MAVNNFIRHNLGNKQDVVQLLRKGYNSFKFSMLSLPEVLSKKGVDDATKLPKYFYRDDALRLWKAILAFIQEVIVIYYKTDNDVVKDTELQAWLQDAQENGFPLGERGIKGDHELPKSLATIDQLVHVLTCIVFTCSCQQAAVNFGLMDVAGFIPNTPHLMRRPPPTKKNEASLESIMKTLPNKSQAAHQIAFLYVTTKFAEDERFLGDSTHSLLTGDEAEAAISRFQASLQNISDSIKARNESLEMPYINLLPERIPDSIAI